jgi:hypothetical protein
VKLEKFLKDRLQKCAGSFIISGLIGQNVVTRAWNEACSLAKVKGVTLYQGAKHSTLSDLAKRASDAQLIKLTGRTNTRVISRYAQSNVEDVRALLS